MPEVRLKPGKEKKIVRRYPWVQRGECTARGVEDGQVARLLDSEGKFVALGTYNSQSRFRFRVLTLEDEPIDSAWFRRRFDACVALRAELGLGGQARRLVYSEADGLAGLIVDQYGPHLVAQVRSLGMERLKPLWASPLVEATQAESVLERSEMAGRAEEGLGPVFAPIHGDPPGMVEIVEDGLAYRVPLRSGLKTGHYLDQRRTRSLFGASVRPGQRVLDTFCYTGGFAMQAARAGAVVTAVDVLPEAVEIARANLEANGLRAEVVEANAFDWLAAPGPAEFDWIVIDPPAIAKTSAKRDSLKWAVWKLVRHALPRLAPGGRLLVCACSYQLSLQETSETCRMAAGDAGRQLTLERVSIQDVDHPALLEFPEALYLKCLWLRAD